MNYSECSLWKNSLAEQNDMHDPKRTELRESYIQARKNISGLLDKIRDDFPNLTLHDISHVDTLWKTASVIIGDDYEITPLEGYILGCAFLIHDAALCYEAFDGKENLRATIVWKDCFAEIRNNDKIKAEDKEYEADFMAIRIMHAQQATKILDKLFKRADGSSYYIIENQTLRDHLKTLISDIAYSHHWSIDQVSRKLLTQENALAEFPKEWRINPQKLACIIRCADAAHLDSGRAPDYLFHILKLNGVSYNHWKAQNFLAQIDVDTNMPDRVKITSTKKFEESDFNAWNVAYDAVVVLNNEIKSSNRLLKSINPNLCFQAKEVAGAFSREELSQYIRTVNWTPCEATIHISNVADLISNLGGSKLYGNEDHLLIVFRELIQNARDAIKAREHYDPDFKDGVINITLTQVDNKVRIIISDNGIGMSKQTITNYLLNFGSSFWQSDLAKQEFQGLRSSEFLSIGKYGIGFYSIFMVAEQVYVKSRRFDDGLENTTQLKFPHGLTLSPIVAQTKGNSNISTAIEFIIDITSYQSSYSIKRNVMGESNFDVPFHKVISALCAGLDVDVFYQDDEIAKVIIHENIENPKFNKCQWLKDISFAEYQNNNCLIDYIDKNYHRLEYIRENGHIVGLAALHMKGRITGSKYNFLSNNTIGGLCSSFHSKEDGDFIGYLDYYSETSNRNSSSKRRASDDTMKSWIEQQLGVIGSFNNVDLLYLPYTLFNYKIDPLRLITLLIVFKDGKQEIMNISSIINELQLGKRFLVLKSSISSNIPEVHYDLDKAKAKLEPIDMFFMPIERGGFNELDFVDNKPQKEYTLLGCLWRTAEQQGCDLVYSEIPDFVKPIIGKTMCSALVIETLK